MIELKSRVSLNFGFDRSEDVVQRATQGCDAVSTNQTGVGELLTHKAYAAPWLQLQSTFFHVV
jgi:hypothetical protein